MGTINVRKMVVAGLVAGLVLLVFDFITGSMLFSGPMATALAARNLDLASLEGAVPVFLGMDIVYGLLIAFVYAAIRPRFGAGPKAGLIAGAVVWASSAIAQINTSAMGFIPLGLTAGMLAAWLVAMMVAGHVAGRLYSE